MPQPPSTPPQYRGSVTVVLWEDTLSRIQQAIRQLENVSGSDEFNFTIEFVEEGKPVPLPPTPAPEQLPTIPDEEEPTP